jgi:hypothetical protein
MFRRKKKNQSNAQDEDPSDSTPEPSAPSSGGFGMFRRGKRSDRNGKAPIAATPQDQQQQHNHQKEYSDSDYDDSEEPYSLQSGRQYHHTRSTRGVATGHHHDDASAASSVTFSSKTSRDVQSQASRGSKATNVAATSPLPLTAEEQFMAYYAQRKLQSSPEKNVSVTPVASSAVDPSEMYMEATAEEPEPATTPKSAAELEEERILRARQAVEDRKRKAREAVEARKAKARQAALDKANAGGTSSADPGTTTSEPSLIEKLEQENHKRMDDKERQRKEADERKKREAAEAERRRVEEIRNQRLLEEKEVLRREEEEMARLEEQLRLEEEEARRVAEEDERKKKALLQQELEQIKETEEEETGLLAEADEFLKAEVTLEEERKELDVEIRAEEVDRALLEEKAPAHAQNEKEARLFEDVQLDAEEKARAFSTAEQDEVARLKAEEEENTRLKAEEEARLAYEKKKAEEARLAIERFAEEEKKKAEEARRAIENFALSQVVAPPVVSAGADEVNLVDASGNDPNLDDILDGSISALLDAPPQSPIPSSSKDASKKRGSSLYGSFSKLLPSGMKKAASQEKPKARSKPTTPTIKPMSSLRLHESRNSKSSPFTSSIPTSQIPSRKSSPRELATPAPPPKPRRVPVMPKPASPSPPSKQPLAPTRETRQVSDLASRLENTPKRSPDNLTVDDLGVGTASETPRSFTKSPDRSIDSIGSVCSVDRIPRSPLQPASANDDTPICDNLFVPHLHAQRGGCQVCILKLSRNEKERYDRNGRHLRVVDTSGGCLDCQVFPSGMGEDPVRLCKQCFFDTHIIRPRKREAFSGNGAMVGVNAVQRKSPSGLKFFSKDCY